MLISLRSPMVSNFSPNTSIHSQVVYQPYIIISMTRSHLYDTPTTHLLYKFTPPNRGNGCLSHLDAHQPHRSSQGLLRKAVANSHSLLSRIWPPNRRDHTATSYPPRSSHRRATRSRSASSRTTPPARTSPSARGACATPAEPWRCSVNKRKWRASRT